MSSETALVRIILADDVVDAQTEARDRRIEIEKRTR